MSKYGKNHDEVARYIEQIKSLTPEQIEQVKTAAYAAAADAAAAYAYDAYAAAAYAAAAAAYAYDAAAADAADWKSRWFLRRGAYALAIKHLIGTKGFTQAHYDLLTAPVRLLESFQVETKPELTTSKYSFDRIKFTCSEEFTKQIIGLKTAKIITVAEARYLLGLDK